MGEHKNNPVAQAAKEGRFTLIGDGAMPDGVVNVMVVLVGHDGWATDMQLTAQEKAGVARRIIADEQRRCREVCVVPVALCRDVVKALNDTADPAPETVEAFAVACGIDAGLRVEDDVVLPADEAALAALRGEDDGGCAGAVVEDAP